MQFVMHYGNREIIEKSKQSKIQMSDRADLSDDFSFRKVIYNLESTI